MEEPKIIQIHDYNVSFYGGKLEQKYEIVIGLLNKDFGMIGWIKFYSEKNDIPEDGFDENSLISMNVHLSLFNGIISTLRSGRSIKLLYIEKSKNAMLVEVPPEMPPGTFKGFDFKDKIN